MQVLYAFCAAFFQKQKNKQGVKMLVLLWMRSNCLRSTVLSGSGQHREQYSGQEVGSPRWGYCYGDCRNQRVIAGEWVAWQCLHYRHSYSKSTDIHICHVLWVTLKMLSRMFIKETDLFKQNELEKKMMQSNRSFRLRI